MGILNAYSRYNWNVLESPRDNLYNVFSLGIILYVLSFEHITLLLAIMGTAKFKGIQHVFLLKV